MADILFKTEDWVFSYRVAGICVQGGKVLLKGIKGKIQFGEIEPELLKGWANKTFGRFVNLQTLTERILLKTR